MLWQIKNPQSLTANWYKHHAPHIFILVQGMSLVSHEVHNIWQGMLLLGIVSPSEIVADRPLFQYRATAASLKLKHPRQSPGPWDKLNLIWISFRDKDIYMNFAIQQVNLMHIFCMFFLLQVIFHRLWPGSSIEKIYRTRRYRTVAVRVGPS